MKITIILLLFTVSVQGQNIIDLQGGYLNTDTIIRNTTIINGYIAGYENQQIFDTSVNIGSNVYIREVSGRWWGADPSRQDNSAYIQKAIFQCINRYPLFIPKGNYRYSMPLGIYAFYGGTFVGATLKMYGESSMWGSIEGTTLTYTNTAGMALNIQLNKGTEISNMRIIGLHVSPGGPDAQYFQTSFADYKHPSFSEWHTGISIDPQANPNGSSSGSTGIWIHNVTVSGFVTLVNVTGSNSVKNGDNLIFEKIQWGDGRVILQCGNAQAKGCVIRDCFGWGSVHTAYRFGRTGNFESGSWMIDNNSFAGRLIKPFDISAGNWFQVTVNKLYCEQIYQIGTVAAEIPISISNSTFDFAYKSQAGDRELLYTYYNQVVFRDCMFRYYGVPGDTLKIASQGTFENCKWSGVRQYRINTSLHLGYGNGQFYISPK